MKAVISAVSLLSFFFISCTVKTPDLVVTGVQTQEALSFLEQYQAGEKTQKDFDIYIQQLRANYAPGFEWDQYWSGIRDKKLYKNLKEKEFNQLLSLNRVSCEQKDWGAFSSLLLQIAKSDNKLLFSKYLTDLQKACFTWLPDPAFKAILQFLSEKREQETKKISKQHRAYLKQGQSATGSLQDKSSKAEKYTYTEELIKVLSDEKSKGYTARNWADVLEVVDKDFWMDAPWIIYQSEDRSHLQSLLKIEWDTYEYIRHGLNMDILLMFEEKNKMEDIIKLAEYEKYFPDQKSVDWSALWKKLLLQYPTRPKNGNVEALLPLYKYSSCRDGELFNYIKVLDQWRMYSRRQAVQDFCDNLRRRHVHDFIGSRGVQELTNMARELFEEILDNAKEEAQQAGEEVKKTVIEDILKRADTYHRLDMSLIDQIRSGNPVGFIKDFREKEWNQLVCESSQPLGEVLDSSSLWWLAYVLSLYSGENDSSIIEAVSQFSGEEWNTIITGLLNSYISESSFVDNDLFDEALNKVKLVYNQEVETSLCSFFSMEESQILVQKYDPQWVISLLEGLFWSKRPAPSEGNEEMKEVYCSELVSKQKRNTLLYELFPSLLKQKTLERETDSYLKESVSDIWSAAVQVMDLSVKINNFTDSPVWHLSFNALFHMREETNNYDFFVEFFEQIRKQLLLVAEEEENLVLDQLREHIWQEPPATDHHKIYRDWLMEILGGQLDIQPDEPPFDNEHIAPPPPRPALSTYTVPYQPFFKQGYNTSKYQRVSFFFNNQQANGKSLLISQRAAKAEQGRRRLKSISNYGQIFIKETNSLDDFDYKIAVLTGMEIGSPYVSSYFVGLDVQRKVHSFIYLGLDYAFHYSKPSSIVKDIKNTYMGLDVSYPLLKHSAYFNGYLQIFKSYLNLAGFYTAKLSVPLQIGMGVMAMEDNKIHASAKWGIGPHLQLNPYWGVQFLFHQTVSVRRLDFLYTWSSLLVTFRF